MGSKDYALKWTDYTEALKSMLGQILSTESFTDVILYCEGKSIKCHKVILTAYSEYFMTILGANPHPQPIILMKDVRYDDMLALVRFMYTGEAIVLENQVTTLMNLAQFLKLKGLSDSPYNSSIPEEPEPVAAINRRQRVTSIEESSLSQGMQQSLNMVYSQEVPYQVSSANVVMPGVASTSSQISIGSLLNSIKQEAPLDSYVDDNDLGMDTGDSTMDVTPEMFLNPTKAASPARKNSTHTCVDTSYLHERSVQNEMLHRDWLQYDRFQKNIQSLQPPPPARRVSIDASQHTQQMSDPKELRNIWEGELDWQESLVIPGSIQRTTKTVRGQISSLMLDGDPTVKADTWPSRLEMQLIPKALVSSVGTSYFRHCRSVLLNPEPSENTESLARVMSSGYAACIYFEEMELETPCNIKVLVIIYSIEKQAYVGIIPDDQTGFLDKVNEAIRMQKNRQGVASLVVAPLLAGSTVSIPGAQ
ncbi:uncharacterized protein LOC136043787 [Artemia franciscana]|uniref:BTB domain-containing protein n=1 Tax=Artemia franciscana TaxID=6661 RepID=A0AA88HU83_ARTSF|nr:hypothetical protein QYM36_010472 [Artemia franciscana]